MENFIVSARKYRPVTFDSVVGQASITNTLKNAIRNNHLAQAFLFCGPRGVGKTTCARILAKTINCENVNDSIEACDSCESCTSFNTSHSFNIHELDAASNNTVDDIRSLIEQVRIAPQVGKYNIYIIDEVHMLSLSAFNAFLKTLEEPPSYAIFILATTSKQKIIPTILSRCQIFDFNRISILDISNHLAAVAKNEKIEAEQDALHVIAQKADGSLRDALSIFDQIVSFTGNEITYKAVIENLNILDYDYYFKITDVIFQHNIPSSLLVFDEILERGFDGHNFITGLSEHLRNLLVCKDKEMIQLLQVGDNIKEKYLDQSNSCSQNDLLAALDIANKCDISYVNNVNKRLAVELALMQLCSLGMSSKELVEGQPPFMNPPKGEVQKVTEPKASYSPNTAPKENVKLDADKEIKAENTDEIEKTNSPGESESISVNSDKDVVDQTTVKTDSPNLDIAEKKKPVETQPSEKKDRLKFKPKTISIQSANTDKTDELKESDPDGKDEKNTGIDLKSIDKEKFVNAWNGYAKMLHDQGKHSLYSTITKRPPVILDGNEIQLIIDNTVQRNELNEEKLNLHAYLKEKLGLSYVKLNTDIIKEDKEKKPYTSIEKFNRMAEKNPSINNLRQQLNLDLD